MSAVCRDGETLVAIQNWERQCHNIARQSGGKFRSPETIECDELFKAAKALDDAPDRCTLARTAFEFAYLCLTKIKTELEGPAERIFDGRGLQAGLRYQRQEQLDALANIVEEGSLSSVKRAFMVLARTRGAVKARYELFREMLNALSEHETRRDFSLYEAAIRARDRTRRSGRAPGRYVVSRTLLIKGLEFDHAILLDATALDRKNLYVALTRGSRSLTVLATSPVLTPQ